MFIIELSVNDFIQVFKNLIRKVFTLHKMSVIFMLSEIQKIIISYLIDNLYSSENLKTELKKNFDKKIFMFDCFYATVIKVKIILSVIIIQKCSSCLFINYNELNKKSENCNMLKIQNFSATTDYLI